MNPCPCGWAGHPRRVCTCGPGAVARYRGRLSGPLLDRIDVHTSLAGLDPDWIHAPTGGNFGSGAKAGSGHPGAANGSARLPKCQAGWG
jgi:predicted ATPase with chaperone activity